MFSIEDISRALTIYNSMKDRMEFEGVTNILSEREAKLLIDIMCELNLIREVLKNSSWYDYGDVEYKWVWINYDEYEDC